MSIVQDIKNSPKDFIIPLTEGKKLFNLLVHYIGNSDGSQTKDPKECSYSSPCHIFYHHKLPYVHGMTQLTSKDICHLEYHSSKN